MVACASRQKTKIILFFLLLSSPLFAIMTRCEFDSLQVGEKFSDSEECFGKPYNRRRKGDDIYEYEYVEKISFTNKTTVTVNHYFVTVSNGIIIGKRFEIQQSPAYNMIYQEDPNIYSY